MTETTIETNSLLIRNALLQSNAARLRSNHVLLLAIAVKLGVAA